LFDRPKPTAGCSANGRRRRIRRRKRRKRANTKIHIFVSATKFLFNIKRPVPPQKNTRVPTVKFTK
jgi:hypothetical protein